MCIKNKISTHSYAGQISESYNCSVLELFKSNIYNSNNTLFYMENFFSVIQYHGQC